jgi:hypothetical protein
MNSLKLKGKIRVSTDSGILSDVENTVTGLFEDLVAAGTVDHLFVGSHPVELGKTFIVHSTPMPTSSYANFANSAHSLFTVYLLNLSQAERQALKKTSHLLPVYDGSFEIDSSKVVGYANAYPATAGKKGYVQPLETDFLVNYRRHGLMFKWDADVLSGTYNTIAVGMNVMSNNRFAGICMFMGLESANQALGEAAPSGYLLRPGVKTADGSLVLTNDNEILLGDSASTQTARKVMNLQTGVITILETTDPRYDFPLYNARFAQLVCGDYLVVEKTAGQVYRVALKTKEETSVASNSYGCFLYDGYLYVKYSGNIFRAYDATTFTLTTAKNIEQKNMNIPTEFLESISNYNLRVTNIGDKYLLSFTRVFTASGIEQFNDNQKAIICTDIMDVANSIVDIVPNVNTNCGCVIGGDFYFFNNLIPNPLTYRNTFQYHDSTGAAKTVKQDGTKMCRSGMYGNLFSFHTYEEDQEIPEGKDLKLEYYYTFEQ